MSKIDSSVVEKVTQRLPSLPQSTLRALSLLNDPDYKPAELAKIIGLDPALAARVLQWANSPFYGLRFKVSTLNHAIMVVGANGMRELLLAISVHEMLNRKMPGYGLERGDLWRHAVAVAAGSRWLATAHNHKDHEQAFVAGLLHDIGKLVLDELLRNDSTWLSEWNILRAQGIPFIELERWLIGMDHAQLGGRIASEWNLPASLVDAITYHHEPELATSDPILTCWVHLADAAALMLGLSLGYDGLNYRISNAALVASNFKTLDLEALLQVEVAAVSEAQGILANNTRVRPLASM